MERQNVRDTTRNLELELEILVQQRDRINKRIFRKRIELNDVKQILLFENYGEEKNDGKIFNG